MDPDGEPKYLNSSESGIYRKSRVLYGLFHAKEAIRREGCVMVVEGYMDVLQLMQAGIENVVATCGTAMTREHGEMLKRHSERLALLFDGDDAGVRAAVRAGDVLIEAGAEPIVVLLPEGDDPDTVVAAEGPDSLRSMVDQGTPYLRFKWEHLGKRHDMNVASGRHAAVGEMLDAIAPVGNEETRALMAGQVAEWSAGDDTLVAKAIAKRRGQRGRRREPVPDQPEQPTRPIWKPPNEERDLVAWMLGRPDVCQMIRQMGIETFSDSTLREMAATLIRLCDSGQEPSAAALLSHNATDASWTEAVTGLDRVVYDDTTADTAVPELIASVQLRTVKERVDALRVRMRDELDAATQRDVNAMFLEAQQEYLRLRAILSPGPE